MSAVPTFSCTEPDPATEQALAGLDRLAEQAVGLSDPNPRVACRLLLADGRVFEGHTQAAGGPHAEVMALRAARAAHADLKRATALVTLEPCSHHGSLARGIVRSNTSTIRITTRPARTSAR